MLYRCVHGQMTPDDTAHDDLFSGSLGKHMLNIENSVKIMDHKHNVIYDIPYEHLECSIRLGALRIQHPGKTISLRGPDTKAWLRAISYQQTPIVWYVSGDEDCQIIYGGAVLGVTPCVVMPPFSWEAFRQGSYEIVVQRPDLKPQVRRIEAASGTHTIRFPDGPPAKRDGAHPDGDTLVLNTNRSLVLAELPYLTDSNGVVVLAMPEAAVKVGLLKRNATISWEQPGLGQMSIEIKCDSPLKYDKLQEMLPPPDRPQVPPQYNTQGPNAYEPIKMPQKRPWWSWRRKRGDSRWNRGVYNGIDLRITPDDLETHLDRFEGYSFEAVCANLLASMGYVIKKGYDVKSNRMLGATRADKGVDVIATKGSERVIVQCKLWRDQCGGPDVNKTLGAATTERGTCILMISTGGFTAQASAIAKESSIDVYLWDWNTIKNNIKKHLL